MTFVVFRRPLWRRATALAALALAALAAQAGDAIEPGRRIYRDGVLPTGAPLRATVEHDVELSGTRAACINCHRRSGYGGMEGDRVVPAIVAGALFRTGRAAAGASPGYDVPTLKRALRDGVHFSGRPLSTLMPRYPLAEPDLDALIAYLQTLATAPVPGVVDDELHFATLVTEGVPARQRRSLLGVLEAYVRSKNAEIRVDRRRERRTVIGHGRVYRSVAPWRLHVWELHGPPADWPQQMERYYRAQPVYAVLGGVGRGRWQEVQATCERLELPCLFPNTEQPQVPESDFFSLYFTRGVLQEAELLAQALRAAPDVGTRRIVQVYRTQDAGEAAANVLRSALAGVTGVELRDRVVRDGDSDFWKSLSTENCETLVLWLRDADVARLSGPFVARTRLVVADSLLDDATRAVPEPLRAMTRVLSLREPPAAWQDRRVRLTAWLKSQGLDLSDERIQSNTHLTLTLVSRAIDHMRTHYSRENLIERIEHLVQTGSWQSIYPQLSLGPGQRVASHGGSLLAMQTDGSLTATGNWIVLGNSLPPSPSQHGQSGSE